MNFRKGFIISSGIAFGAGCLGRLLVELELRFETLRRMLMAVADVFYRDFNWLGFP